mgnify:CR=1 FL=1
MTPPDWASKKVRKISMGAWLSKEKGHAVGEHDAARLLRLEHARAVREIKRLKQNAYFVEKSFDDDQFDAYIAALDDVKTALQRGRTQKGTR